MIPTSILAAQIVISLKAKKTPNIKSKNINVTTNINKSRFLSITFFSFTPPTQTSAAHTATHEPRHKRCRDIFYFRSLLYRIALTETSIISISELDKGLPSKVNFKFLSFI